MIRSFIAYPIQFFVLVLIQVLILNNIQFSGYINPFLYIVFLLWLPFETPKWLLLLLAFVLGITVDVFSDSLGMHASACLFLAFCRPGILALISPRDGYDANQSPSIQDFGWLWFIMYASLLTLLHHAFLFFVEVFRFSGFFSTLGRIFASSLFTLILILLTQLMSYNAAKRK